jgi:hypothetical protein
MVVFEIAIAVAPEGSVVEADERENYANLIDG